MKKITYLIAIGVTILFSACNKFTEITPKGVNLLSTVDQLDLLLNYNYGAQTFFKFDDLGVIVNDHYPYTVNVPVAISSPTKTLNYAYLTYDESVDRATLTPSDDRYAGMYNIIDNIDNVILSKADAASGNKAKAAQLKAEAYIQRAYFHYLLVNIFAKAYNATTSANDGGIPYVMDNDISKQNTKVTVAEVYKDILADINAAFALNSLPDVNVNNMRVGKGFAYAVQARVLLSMGDYANALIAANASLAINSSIQDLRPEATLGFAGFVVRAPLTPPDNLFYAASDVAGPLFMSFTPEFVATYFEPGNLFNNTYPAGAMYPAANPLAGIPNSELWFAQTFSTNMGGLCTSDTYFAKAECLARRATGTDLADATAIVNTFRQYRINPAVYQPLPDATSTAQAMGYVMKVTQAENYATYKNFFDIKRWNTETAYQQTITRTINGVTYTLKPNSPLYIFPFPQNAIAYNNSLTQNY